MNLRQKAKKYKQELELLRNMTIPTINYFSSTNKPIVTLECQQIIDIDDYYRWSDKTENYHTMVNNLMMRQLSNQMLNYAEITMEPFDYDKQIIKARMKIIDMR